MGRMTEQEAWQLILHEREENRAGWETIAAKLKGKGYLSPKTGKPLAPTSVRFLYYGKKDKKQAAAPTEGSDLQQRLDMIQRILSIKTASAQQKVELIQTLFDG